LFRKPAKEMLGKKCYEEFERRVDVCPHCPGWQRLRRGQLIAWRLGVFETTGPSTESESPRIPSPIRGDLLVSWSWRKTSPSKGGRRNSPTSSRTYTTRSSQPMMCAARCAKRSTWPSAFRGGFRLCVSQNPRDRFVPGDRQRGACREVIETLVGAMSNPLPSETVTRHPPHTSPWGLKISQVQRIRAACSHPRPQRASGQAHCRFAHVL
jgi:hypothetical protein